MKDIFYLEMRKRIEEIASTENRMGKDMLIDTVEKLTKLSLAARREGLFELESAVYEMDGFPGIKYLKIMVYLVCDGTSPDDLEETLYCRYFSAPFRDYDALQYLIMMYGILAIRAGKNPRLIEESLLYMLPEELSDEYERRKEEIEQLEASDMIMEEFDTSMVDALCSDDIETGVKVGDEYYYVVKMLEETLAQFDDRAVQRILRDVGNSDLECAMKVMSGKTRRILFKNMSQRLAVLIAEDYGFMGTVRLSDACSACRKIFMVFLKLIEQGEIIYNEELMLKEMATVFLSEKDTETKKTIKESENKLYRLWEEYQQHSNRWVE